VFPGFKSGKPRLHALSDSTEEVSEGLIKVAEGFLGGAFGDFVHPGKLGLLELIQFAMQVHSRLGFASGSVSGDFSLEAPVVGEACAASVFVAEGLLDLV
jgi:hypothetical protein